MLLRIATCGLVLLSALWVSGLMAQIPVNVNHSKEPIEFLSPKGDDISQPGWIARKYVGQVQGKHHALMLSCDKAVYNQTANRVEAIGHVVLTQGDTLTIKGDTLVYDGQNQQAALRGRVSLQSNRIVLSARQLDYNVPSGVVHYTRGGRLVDGQSVLTSREGYYDVRTRQIELQYAVRVVSPEHILTSEVLIYNTTSRLITLMEPTRISDKDGITVARQGQYDIQEGSIQKSTEAGSLKYVGVSVAADRVAMSVAGIANSTIAELSRADKPVSGGPGSNTVTIVKKVVVDTRLSPANVKPAPVMPPAKPVDAVAVMKPSPGKEPLPKPVVTITTRETPPIAAPMAPAPTRAAHADVSAQVPVAAPTPSPAVAVTSQPVDAAEPVLLATLNATLQPITASAGKIKRESELDPPKAAPIISLLESANAPSSVVITRRGKFTPIRKLTALPVADPEESDLERQLNRKKQAH